jgi:hypothetical protein
MGRNQMVDCMGRKIWDIIGIKDVTNGELAG